MQARPAAIPGRASRETVPPAHTPSPTLKRQRWRENPHSPRRSPDLSDAGARADPCVPAATQVLLLILDPPVDLPSDAKAPSNLPRSSRKQKLHRESEVS